MPLFLNVLVQLETNVHFTSYLKIELKFSIKLLNVLALVLNTVKMYIYCISHSLPFFTLTLFLYFEDLSLIALFLREMYYFMKIHKISYGSIAVWLVFFYFTTRGSHCNILNSIDI